MDITIADPTKFFFPTEEYLAQYQVLPPPLGTSLAIKVEETPLVYNQQENTFCYMRYEDYSTATTTPSTSTSTSTGYGDSINNNSNNGVGSSIDLSHHQPGLMLHQSFSETTSAASPGTPISCCMSPALLATATASPTTPSPYYHPSAEFMQYSKEPYEQPSSTLTPRPNSVRSHCQEPMRGIENETQDLDEAQTCLPAATISSTELRRQIHIQSEQKRRAQIKDGFEDLRNELPSCLNKKMSKVALLHRTIQHIQHLKSTQLTILSELERLMGENDQLRKFQHGVLQKQALEKIYQVNGL